MMKQLQYCAALAMFALSVPVTADAARLGYQTNAINGTDFEVVPRIRDDTDGYWCAAADFARRDLGAGWQDPIYVLRGYGPSVTTGRRTAVQFSLKQPAANAPTQTSGVRGPFVVGSSVSVQGANARCGRRQIFDD
jgi:hypothetical protein